jgi:hypothetical protein
MGNLLAIGALSLNRLNWSTVGLYWDGQTLSGSPTPLHRLRESGRPLPRFLIQLLSIEPGSKTTTGHVASVHANMLVYDRKLLRLERVEPMDPSHDRSGNALLDRAIVTAYRDAGYFESGPDNLRPPQASYYGPDQSFQSELRQSPHLQYIYLQSEQIRQHPGEQVAAKTWHVHGQCLPWVFLYTQMRLRNPELHPEEVKEHLLGQVGVEGNSLTNFIARYSLFMHKEMMTMLKNAQDDARALAAQVAPVGPGANVDWDNIDRTHDVFSRMVGLILTTLAGNPRVFT